LADAGLNALWDIVLSCFCAHRVDSALRYTSLIVILLHSFGRLRMGLIHVKEETHAAVELLAKIAFLGVQVAQFGSAVATLSNCVASARMPVGIVYSSNQNNFAVAHASTPPQAQNTSAQGSMSAMVIYRHLSLEDLRFCPPPWIANSLAVSS